MSNVVLKHALQTVLIVQLIAILQKHIFDFLNYMWFLTLMNFIQIIVLIFAYFGTKQEYQKYIKLYLYWSFIWIIWNGIICILYLNLTSYLPKAETFLRFYLKNPFKPGKSSHLHAKICQTFLHLCLHFNENFFDLFQSIIQIILALIGTVLGVLTSSVELGQKLNHAQSWNFYAANSKNKQNGSNAHKNLTQSNDNNLKNNHMIEDQLMFLDIPGYFPQNQDSTRKQQYADPLKINAPPFGRDQPLTADYPNIEPSSATISIRKNNSLSRNFYNDSFNEDKNKNGTLTPCYISDERRKPIITTNLDETLFTLRKDSSEKFNIGNIDQSFQNQKTSVPENSINHSIRNVKSPAQKPNLPFPITSESKNKYYSIVHENTLLKSPHEFNGEIGLKNFNFRPHIFQDKVMQHHLSLARRRRNLRNSIGSARRIKQNCMRTSNALSNATTAKTVGVEKSQSVLSGINTQASQYSSMMEKSNLHNNSNFNNNSNIINQNGRSSHNSNVQYQGYVDMISPLTQNKISF